MNEENALRGLNPAKLVDEKNTSSKRVVMAIDEPKKITPMLLLSGERNPDGTMKNILHEKLPTQLYGLYCVLKADKCGNIAQIPFPKMVEAESPSEEFKHLGGKFYEGRNAYYFKDAKGDFVPMSDFLLKIREKQRRARLDGTISEVFVVKVNNFDTDEEFQLEIPAVNWLEIFSIIEKTFQELLVATDEIPNARERFKRLASLILKKSQFATKTLTTHWGWGLCLEDGSRKFQHGGLATCKSSKKLAPPLVNPSERTRVLSLGFDITQVAEPTFTEPIFVYTCGCYADALFTDAGYTNNFSLMLIALSGFGKTSYVKAQCSPFVPEKERVVSVRSTEAAMYVEQEKAYDDVLVVDDFNREGSEREIRQKLKVMRALIRSYSDKTPRKKWSGMNETKGPAIRGGCIFTGETKMTGQLPSGELRYIKIFLKERINGKILQVYQQNPEIMQVFFSEWIRFLEKNYTAIVGWIRKKFPLRREEFASLKEPRLIDACVHLNLTAYLLSQFLMEATVFSEEEAIDFVNSLCNITLDILSRQRDELTEKSPVTLYIEEIFNLIGTGKLLLAANLDIYCHDLQRYGGYIDNDIYMLKKDETHVAVIKAFAAREDYFTESIEDIAKALKKQGLTKCDADGCLKRASSKIAGRPRMLALIVNKCENFLKEENQNE